MARQAKRKEHLSAGVILVDGEGRILLQLRDDDPDIPFPNHWGITGGDAEKRETPDQAARREVLEETGLALDTILPFRVYEEECSERRRSLTHFFFARTVSTAEEMVVGEGQELRFFTADELEDLPLAYQHREVLQDFVGSSEYRTCVLGDSETAASFCRTVDEGGDWLTALLDAVQRWATPEEVVGGRRYRYLIGGEAFDWLLLAERLLEAADGAIPAEEREELLFHGKRPREMDEEEFKHAIGSAKHRAHLNYIYGIVIEEALQLAAEEEVLKEHRSRVWDRGDTVEQLVFERVYGRGCEELLAEYRESRSLPATDELSYSDLREFTYWLFKYRVNQCDPARVASDTRKAMAKISGLEAAARRRSLARDSLAVDEGTVVDGEVVRTER